MSRYIGHAETVAALTRNLPPVALLLGPPSIGKWTLTHHLAERHQVGMVDRFLNPDRLSIDDVRRIVTFVSTAPFGAVKLVQARLDGASEAALNALLKTLEEPPPTARFLLTAPRPPLPTIMSRAQVYRMGLLSDTDVTAILCGHGLPPAQAVRAAVLGRGQLKTAMSIRDTDAARVNALALARALATGNRELFDKAFISFTDTDRDLFLCLLREAITGRWTWFTAADTAGLSPARLMQLLIAVNRVSAAQARLGVRGALETFIAAP